MNTEFFLDDPTHLLRVIVRLTVAVLLGGAVGFERESEHKRAGIRTHMLVALGSALFTLVVVETPGMSKADASRVMQGIVAGIGFLGAGTILKLSDQHEVKGLTTAASIWLTAAVGMAVGVGLFWPSLICVIFALIVLFVLHKLERWLKRGPHGGSRQEPRDTV
jgi:putative Mg2+ transporter-C (MgtC) family protein